ncbi:hypothetical protein [Streptomyces sp. RG80]|uniref:hypothetical protein n=1 Tax=Streptomyces sp. RG80 TaxID=3157340 RepID=UPI00338FDD23
MGQSDRGVRTSRARACVGLAAVVLGCFLAGDLVQRARAAMDFGFRWWPWALLSLAVVNLLRSALPTGSLIGPFLLVSIALVGLAVSRRISAGALADFALPGLLTVGGAMLLISTSEAGPRSSWSRILTTGRVVIPHGPHRTVTVRAVLGELRADLTRATENDWLTVHVTALAGHIRITVPRDRRVRIYHSGTVLTRVVVSGPELKEAPDPSVGVTVHVLGVCSFVAIVRT